MEKITYLEQELSFAQFMTGAPEKVVDKKKEKIEAPKTNKTDFCFVSISKAYRLLKKDEFKCCFLSVEKESLCLHSLPNSCKKQ